MSTVTAMVEFPALQRLEGWRAEPQGRPSPLQDCVLVIPTYRRAKELLRLLGLLAVLPDAPGEVLIVDGSPEPEVNRIVQAWARNRQLPFALAYVSSPPGLTRQRNVGIDACTAEFIFFLDDDCLPNPGYFRALRQVFVDDPGKRIGAVRGMLTNGLDTPLTGLWRLRYALRLLPRGEPGRYYHCGTSGTWNMVPRFKGVRIVDILAGGASAYRREVFEQHRFSEFFYGYAQGEDMEMSLRIGKHWKLMACGDALVYHDHAQTGRPPGCARGRMAFRNRYFIWRRHSSQAGLGDQIRFWADHVLAIAYNGAVFLTRPWRPYNLAYAWGTFLGAIECLFAPPTYQEPRARKHYDFVFQPLSGQK